MNRRGFLRGVLSVLGASVAAKVAPKRPVAEPVMGVGRGSLLVMDNLSICNADAGLPLYVEGETLYVEGETAPEYEERRLLSGRAGDRARVWLDGREVTGDCLEAIVPQSPGVEGPGAVYLTDRDSDGNLYLRGDDIASSWHHGRVRWEPLGDADAVLPLYIDDNGDLREASGRLVRYIVLDNAGIDTRLLRDVSDWTTPEARLLVESINSRYGGTADALFDQLVTGIERSGEMLQDHWRVYQEFMADPDSIIRRQAAAWRGKGA